jgi:hypothetical protein
MSDQNNEIMTVVLDLFLLNENAGTYIIIVKNLDAGVLKRKEVEGTMFVSYC